MLNDDKLRYIHFDFHHECRKDWSNVEKLVEKVSDDLQNFGYVRTCFLMLCLRVACCVLSQHYLIIIPFYPKASFWVT